MEKNIKIYVGVKHSKSLTFIDFKKVGIPHPPFTYLIDTLSVAVDLSVLDTSYKWNHIICGSLCLTSFSYHNVSRLILCSMRVSIHHSIL